MHTCLSMSSLPFLTSDEELTVPSQTSGAMGYILDRQPTASVLDVVVSIPRVLRLIGF